MRYRIQMIASLALLCFGSPLTAAKKEARTFEVAPLAAAKGDFVFETVSLAPGGWAKPVQFTGTVTNRTGKDWTIVGFSIEISDKRTPRYQTSPLIIQNFRAGESKPFYYTLSGRVDFDTVTFNTRAAFGEYVVSYKLTLTKPTENDDLAFDDGIISVNFVPRRDRIELTLANKSESVARLLWDEAAFVSKDGGTSKAMHTGIRYAARNEVQSPASIPPGASIRDFVVPTENVYFEREWKHRDILPQGDASKDMLGKQMGVLLPIEIDGKRKDYFFQFSIVAVD